MSVTISRSSDASTIEVQIVLAPYTAADEPQTIAHPILGSAQYDVTLRPARPGQGQMKLLLTTYADADAARKFHRAAATFTASSSDGSPVPAVYVPTAIGVAQFNEDYDLYEVDVSFQELA